MRLAHSSWLIAHGKITKMLLFFIFLSAISYELSTVYCAPTSSKELIDDADIFDGRVVTYKGEAVTAILKRGEYSWINLNDGANAIGVWCKTSLLGEVKYLGDYKHKGDIVEVEGAFHRACPQHRGEMDIHAEKVRILRQGFNIKEDIDKKKMHAAAALLIITLFTVVFFKRKA